ncbi:MAG: bifunctional enoyl-CoA hydratase/phosphate acetyltransferase [Desulfobulbaceae bacterium BRH_c16a]|nr:MAG: bifunctional enoyl-CoA hydratase/phosphate acetyltransferase [Desulfobulbaceae bacterium BRH_c16a]
MITNKTFNEIAIGDCASLRSTLTKRDIDRFGMLSGDMNPTHFSDEYAQMLLLRNKAVGHSMWGAALISGLLGSTLPGPGTVYQAQTFQFHNPTEIGDTLTATVTVTGKIAENQIIVLDCQVRNQRGDLIVSGEAKVTAPIRKPTDIGSPYATMEIRETETFNQLLAMVREWDPIPTAVCHPCSEDALLGAVDAARQNLIVPILVGPRQRILSLALALNIDISPYRLLDTLHSHESAEKAVALCRLGEAGALMKGSLHTDELLREIANKERGLRTASRFSHVFIMDVPTYPRPLFITDAAVNILPSLEDKVDILNNVIRLAHALGNPEPKVAILSAVETVNQKIPATIDAAALCKMADRGQITGAIIDGPLAFDNAISKEAARIKGIRSPVAGVADICLVPDLEAGNILAKQLTYLADADSAGLVMGAKVPIILTSRADSAESRLASCAVAVAYAYWQKGELVKNSTLYSS